MELNHATVSEARALDRHLGAALERANPGACSSQSKGDCDSAESRHVRIAIVLGGQDDCVLSVVFTFNNDLIEHTLVVEASISNRFSILENGNEYNLCRTTLF